MAKKSNRNGKKSKGPSPKKKSVSKVVTRSAPQRRSSVNASSAPFGPVSAINTAPVAIGNSLRGMKTQVFHTATGARVVGRDFGFQPLNSGTVTAWVLVGGIPITPMCLPSSILRQMAAMYGQFKLRSLTAHFITSSPTSANGDIMFYVRRNEGSVLPGPTTSTFLPYVLSDEYTILGPQWTNHSVYLGPSANWKSTDMGATPKLELYSDRDLFLYSKTSTSDSPGYIILDYDYEFREVSINPRIGNVATFAGTAAQWNQVALVVSGAKTAGTTALVVNSFGTTGIGGTTITALSPPTGAIYEIILDVSNSTFSAATSSNFFMYALNGTTNNTMAIADGQIMYLSAINSGAIWLFNSIEGALADSTASQLYAGASVTYAETLQVWAKIVYQENPNQNKYSQ